jgi:hypothetical protein
MQNAVGELKNTDGVALFDGRVVGVEIFKYGKKRIVRSVDDIDLKTKRACGGISATIR